MTDRSERRGDRALLLGVLAGDGAAAALVGWVVDRFGRNAQASSRDSIAGTFLGFVLLNAPILMGGQVAQLDSRTVLFIAYGAIALFALFRTLPLLPETRPALGEEAPTPIR